MKCKYCNEEMPERGHFCPICGGDNSMEPEEIVITPEELLHAVDEVAEKETVQLMDGEEFDEEFGEMLEDEDEFEDDEDFEDDEEFEDEEDYYAEPSPKLKRARFLAGLTGCVATLTLLAVVLFAGISGGWDVKSMFSWIIPKENNVQCKDTYTVDAKKALKKRSVVVATVPGAELTNGELQIYYWNQVYEFLNKNSYYLSYLGLDYTKPLDEQNDYYGNGTWQQYFLEDALEMWHSNIAFAMKAKAEGYQMSAEYRAELDGLRADMESAALKNGYASAEAMLQSSMGPGCTMDDYMSYMETYYLGYSYFAELYTDMEPTMEEIEAYFEANKSSLAQSGVTKESGYTVDIRHILIKIEKLDSESTQTEGKEEELIDGYTQAAWDACYAKAEEILNQWLNGEMTEDAFAELAKTHSADGNASEGGIYTGVEKGYMVETFDAWCFDETRENGHYGIVRTKYGYHIMYFIDKEDIWVTKCRASILEEEAQKLVKEILNAYPMEVTYKKIVLGEAEL